MFQYKRSHHHDIVLFEVHHFHTQRRLKDQLSFLLPLTLTKRLLHSDILL